MKKAPTQLLAPDVVVRYGDKKNCKDGFTIWQASEGDSIKTIPPLETSGRGTTKKGARQARPSAKPMPTENDRDNLSLVRN